MSASALLCAAFAGLAAAMWIEPSPARLLSARGLGESPSQPPGRVRRRGRPARRLGSAAPEPSAAQRIRTMWRGSAIAARRRRDVIELCTSLAGELRAGAMPMDALVTVTGSLPGVCDEAAREARLGGDIVRSLRTAAEQPGAAGLSRLAAAWAVTELTGSGLADGCERVATWLRAEEALRREVGAQLAGARASARLLTLLPVVGLALGSGIGGDPVSFLLGTPYGLLCLVAGGALVGAGLWWTERLARSVEARI